MALEHKTVLVQLSLSGKQNTMYLCLLFSGKCKWVWIFGLFCVPILCLWYIIRPMISSSKRVILLLVNFDVTMNLRRGRDILFVALSITGKMLFPCQVLCHSKDRKKMTLIGMLFLHPSVSTTTLPWLPSLQFLSDLEYSTSINGCELFACSFLVLQRMGRKVLKVIGRSCTLGCYCIIEKAVLLSVIELAWNKAKDLNKYRQ